MTRSDYKADQVRPERVSGTDKGKRAVRAFLRAVGERYSEDAVGSDSWQACPWGRMASVNNMFWKWVMEIPPWGTPEYNAVVCTSVFSWDALSHRMRYRDTFVNMFSENDKDWMYRWATFRLLRMEMKRIERHARGVYIKRIVCHWLKGKHDR